MKKRRLVTAAVLVAVVALAVPFLDDPAGLWLGGRLERSGIVWPETPDWVDRGTLLEAGAPGEWDALLTGGMVLQAVVVDGVFHLYYNGAREYREVDDTNVYRKIGLATSDDGVHFVKHPANPVLDYRPTGEPGEGPHALAVTVADGGTVAHYGGSRSQDDDPLLVDIDLRLATSKGGVAFADRGLVLAHDDPGVWGADDKLLPFASFVHGGVWNVFYLPLGEVSESFTVGIGRGPSPGELEETRRVWNGWADMIPARGPGSFVPLAPDLFALVTNRVDKTDGGWIDVRLGAPELPYRLSRPIRTYLLPGITYGTILHDPARRTFFLYTLSADGQRVGLLTAPDG